jgi:high-affinity iron transporter
MRKALLSLLAVSLGLSACSDPDRDLPAGYRAIPVPHERLRSAEARARGRALFQQHCALCHGARADGRGLRREGLSKTPADFTDPAWRQRATPRRIYHAIREGVAGTPMPSWKALEPSEAWDLVAFLLTVSEGGPTPGT